MVIDVEEMLRSKCIVGQTGGGEQNVRLSETDPRSMVVRR